MEYFEGLHNALPADRLIGRDLRAVVARDPPIRELTLLTGGKKGGFCFLVAYVDFKKAFDSVDSRITWDFLRRRGILLLI